ncbi:site-specific integrase [Massilia sp. CF038]|uniref:tyrosine-type recombinase/integrase n=1 Tax=Massilia sp. CF038 TaxID=1881045 RepID=UPI0009190F47|nr:site-specific integrase [Massilia sp. CF038]SHH10799.1 Integrase [Massilia sp. CF038]
MASRINKLSAILVGRLDKPGYHGDGGGLWLQVSRSGSKSWIFRYMRDGRSHEMGLGSCITVDLAGARAKARACRQMLLDGVDPLGQRRDARRAHALDEAKRITFDECAAAYIDAHRGSWKNTKHVAQWENTIATYASPLIGGLPVAAVDTDLVVKVLRPIWRNKTETAVRLRGRIEAILGWATVSKFRQGDNPARWRGHLDNLLANPNKIAPVKNHPALPWRDVGGFMDELRACEGVAARAIEFTILTACRSGEVRGARWSEIDLVAKVWTIPAGRMKAGKEHRVPLSIAAMVLLKSLERVGDVVFPGRGKDLPLSDMSLTAVLRRMGHGDITVHGFRSTFRDWCSEEASNAFSREVCEHALAHSLPDKVEAAYRRGDLFEKRVTLMQAWASYCAAWP